MHVLFQTLWDGHTHTFITFIDLLQEVNGQVSVISNSTVNLLQHIIHGAHLVQHQVKGLFSF